MNLILSDVEETIMVVDVPDGAPESEGRVRVRGWNFLQSVMKSANNSFSFYRSRNGVLRCCLYVETVLF